MVIGVSVGTWEVVGSVDAPVVEVTTKEDELEEGSAIVTGEATGGAEGTGGTSLGGSVVLSI